MNKARPDNGFTPLISAACMGHLEVVRCLLEHGADKDKAKKNGVSPLWVAAQNGHLRARSRQGQGF